jgi:iron complex transport system substrate-binding protein
MIAIVRALVLVAVVTAAFVGGVAGAAGAVQADGDCSFPVTVTDATGTEVTIQEQPDRVVTADAASAQTLWEIGARDRVVGMPVRSYTAYLNGSGERTDVLTADGTALDVETIVDLGPDLVIAANPQFFSEESIRQLRAANLTVYQYPFEESIEDIYEKTTVYGQLVGECDGARATVEEMRTAVQRIEGRVAGESPPRALYYSFEFTAGSGTFTDDLITTAGGENVAATAGIEGFGPINDETVVDQAPEWIVTTDDEGAIDPTSAPLAATPAVENDRILRLDANLLSQAAPRVVEPLGRMAEAFHPDAMATPAEPTATETATATSTATPAGGEGTMAEPTSESGPGFGVVAVVLAVVVFAVGRSIDRRRGR